MSELTSASPQTTSDLERAPDATIDPGQIIRINARFSGEPKDVLFSFLAPQTEKGNHDPGFSKAGTKITRSGDLYTYQIDTALMLGGKGWWYFYSEDPSYEKRRAKVGTFIVRDVPRALIDRDLLLETQPERSSMGRGIIILGADVTPMSHFFSKKK